MSLSPHPLSSRRTDASQTREVTTGRKRMPTLSRSAPALSRGLRVHQDSGLHSHLRVPSSCPASSFAGQALQQSKHGGRRLLFVPSPYLSLPSLLACSDSSLSSFVPKPARKHSKTSGQRIERRGPLFTGLFMT